MSFNPAFNPALNPALNPTVPKLELLYRASIAVDKPQLFGPTVQASGERRIINISGGEFTGARSLADAKRNTRARVRVDWAVRSHRPRLDRLHAVSR